MEEMTEAIAEEIPAPFLPAALRGLPAALGLFLAAYLFTCLLLYLSYSSRIRPPQAGMAVLGAFAVLTVLFMAWSGVWAAVSRIFRQRAYFAAHLSTAAASYLGWNLLALAVSAAAFGLDMDNATRPMMLAAFWLCGVWTITCHLGLASRLRHRTTLVIALLLVTVVSGCWLAFAHFSDKMMPGAKKGALDLWPPAFRLVNGKPVPEYAAKLRGLKTRVDTAAAESEK